MGDRVDPIVSRLKSKAEETVVFFNALAPDEWEAQVYTDGAEWCVREVLGHFVSAERSLLLMFKDVMRGGEGAPADFDIDRFNKSQVGKLADLTPADLLRQFEAARAQTVDFVSGLDDADLDRVGRHPWFGFDRMEKFLKLLYRHNMLHERDIRRALGGEDGGRMSAVEALAAQLEDQGQRTIDFFRALAPAQWDTTVYAEDAAWRVRDLLAHFVTIERSLHWLIRDMAAGGAGTPDDFDLDRYNRSQVGKLHDTPPEALLAQFEAVRAETVAITRGLSDADLERTGRHAFLGSGRLSAFIEWAYKHTLLHEHDIRRALMAGGEDG